MPPNLIAQLEVGHHDGDLGAGDEEDDQDKGQEAKEVVEAVQPERRDNEKHFHEYLRRVRISVHLRLALTAPNGRMPPIATMIGERAKKDCSGICLGMAFVLTGTENGSALKPRNEPKKISGQLMPSQMICAHGVSERRQR